jgi:hypothetical protein
MTKKIVNEVKSEINTLEAQGHALGKAWKAIQRSDRKQITDFDLPLGKLMLALEAEGSGQIKKARLIACGVNNIDRRRRNDAKHLAANWDELSPMVKRFTSTTALLAAWNKSKKADAPSKPKADKPEQPKADKVSNVGQSEVAKQLNAEDIAVNVLDLLEANNVSLKEFEAAFKATVAILKDEDTNKKAVA